MDVYSRSLASTLAVLLMGGITSRVTGASLYSGAYTSPRVSLLADPQETSSAAAATRIRNFFICLRIF